MKLRISIVFMAAALTFAAEAQSPAANYKTPAQIYAEAQIHIDDPRWAESTNDTDWSLKKRKCLEGNFFKMGFNRSYSGRKRERGLEKIQKKCKKVDVVVDETAYFAGYDKGQLGYCTFRRGFDYGRGVTNPEYTICASEHLKDFQKGYAIGTAQKGVYDEHKAKKERLAFRMQRLQLLRSDIRNNTNTAELTGDKLDWLKKWEQEEQDLRRTMLSLERTNPDVFNPQPIFDQHAHFWPRHWRDVP